MENNFLGLDKNRMELERLENKYPLPRSSYSQLNSFKNCPFTFFLTYIEGGYDNNGNKYTALGSLCHTIFERQGKQMKAKKPFTISEAFELYNRDFFRIEKKYFDDKEDRKKMYQKGITAIEGYYSVYGEETPLYIEKQFLAKIGDGIPPIKSFVDRIDGEEGKPETWTIVDYKTGSQPKSKAYLREDIQMGLYVAQIYAEYKVYPKAVSFYHPVPNKHQTAVHKGDGVYEFTGQRAPVVTFSVADTLIEARRIVSEIAKCIETGIWEKKIDAWNCKNCFKFAECKPFDKQQEGWGAIGGY